MSISCCSKNSCVFCVSWEILRFRKITRGETQSFILQKQSILNLKIHSNTRLQLRRHCNLLKVCYIVEDTQKRKTGIFRYFFHSMKGEEKNQKEKKREQRKSPIGNKFVVFLYECNNMMVEERGCAITRWDLIYLYLLLASQRGGMRFFFIWIWVQISI